MKKGAITICCFLYCLFSWGQDIEGHNKRVIPAEQPQTLEISPSYFDILPPKIFQGMGPFDVRRFIIPVNFMNIGRNDTSSKINILAIAKAKAQYKKSVVIESGFMANELKEIQARMQIQNENTPHFYPKYNSSRALRNEVYEDSRQPFINPFYNPYYRRYSRWRHGYYNSPRGYLFYRR